MERIHVSVRTRPLPPEDAKTSPWRISGNSIFIPNHSSTFEFDRIFDENCKTVEVYEARTKEIVAAAVHGFNGTVFAYGQTNSGKTYTMRGSQTEPGVIPLAVHDLFKTIQREVNREFLLRMSYMEIYNEEINDLLAPEHRKLQIHENLERGIYVAGLREEIVASPEQVIDLMKFGESHRHIGETNMNLYSSRSHTIFRMIIESRDRNEDEENGSSCDAVRVSVLNLVDLAGSERAAKTGAEGVRLKEGSHINKSLMTLGTVIKKLSEGAESQGGHVPYRDSKLTRILQPSLGGNANTAIICNITLAQIHADETKSSLQFASRALRVTNCARVNEILTDAALLKRQKKEIEELRAKLQGSHSEHLEEEILNLRNTLLQTELERERIALELEEEKKSQAEWEKRVREQAKKIENLSSMVLFSNRDETRDRIKKEKRRDTWCPGNLLRENPREEDSSIQSKASMVKPIKPKRDVGPLLPFEELLNENVPVEQPFKQEFDDKDDIFENCNLPNPCTLLHVTNRKKVPPRKKSLAPEDNESTELQAEYENLLLKFETQWTISEIQIDCLRRQLVEADSIHFAESLDCSENYISRIGFTGDKNVDLKAPDAILVIKKLQEQIKVLELEKSSSQQNMDTVVDLATRQNISAKEKIEELYEELLNAQEMAQVANEQLTSSQIVRKFDDESLDFKVNFSTEVEQIMSEVQKSKEAVQSVILLVDEASKSFSALCDVFLDFKTSMTQDSVTQNLILSNYQKLNSCLGQKVSELENEKILLDEQLSDLRKLLEESKLDSQNAQNSLMELSEQQELEKAELLSYILTLEKDISCLTSSSLAKEMEVSRKDLEKTKSKLKETESKLKIVIQEKTKLEGEKAYAEREIKRLLGQNSLLERDLNRRDSLAGRRRDSVIEKSSKGIDSKRPKGLAVHIEQTLQEEYKKLEVFAFEAETRINSLEKELTVALDDREELISVNEGLASELESLTEKLNLSNSELCNLKEEVSTLRQRLEESNDNQENFEKSIKMLVEEKEELAMQLTDSLLELEEERAIWSAKNKDAVQVIEEKEKSNNTQIASLSKEFKEVRNELESCREECRVLKEECREKSLEINELKKLLEAVDTESKHFQENIKEQLSVVTKERDILATQMEKQQNHVMEVEFLQKHCDDQAKVQVEELTKRISCMEVKMHTDEVENNKMKAKLRMRLRGTQAKLDAFRCRYKEALDESDLMNLKYEEAASKLKDRLASKGIEVLNLKKQLADAKRQ
ncbi:hypothetical protein L6164_009315 [Bauhinia variegata]|uniref:Uncharacterized protein n=1 Tax=Bauhinia variegata TaxID=167791 RepID=A0ACB9PJP7_BAUVA|nr:hypothetical protein L6164_009315 [Bauhinia variegata]